MKTVLRIATRESRLALWQAEHVKALLQSRLGLPAELLGMTTRGDQILDRSLSKVGGKGLFVKELETALEQGQAELAVHSLKDVPMDMPEGFTLAAILEREDPSDALVSPRHASIDDLPPGARVGTSSLRRAMQLGAARPDLQVLPLRGNLDTRLRKLDEGGFDAIVLATAGLLRLGLAERIRCRLDLDAMLPAAGQGALGLEVRTDAAVLRAALAGLAHEPTHLACEAERAVSRALGGSCSMPLAAHARWQGGQGGPLVLTVRLGHAQQAGLPLLQARVQGRPADADAARALGRAAADALLAQGAQAYLAAALGA
ncbi:MAG: hydroxymethylbilane synthase [Aquabacterium sp.]